MNDFTPWIEEDLEVDMDSAKIELSGGNNLRNIKRASKKISGKITLGYPYCFRIEDEYVKQVANSDLQFYRVRLSCQFHPLPKDIKIDSVLVQAFLTGDISSNNSFPRVYDIYPESLYDGNTRKIGIKVSPSLKLGIAEIGLGEIDATSDIGQITPEVIGYYGENENSPYWRLVPGNRSLVGVRHFWIIIAKPQNCKSVKLAMFSEMTLQTKKFGIIPVGPSVKDRNLRRHVEICSG